MNIIKLDAIPSTNSFLKEMSANQLLEDFTVVVAENQTEGKGQRGNEWKVESAKSLTFSLLIKNFSVIKFNPFILNILTPVSVFQVLSSYNFRNLKIKWPNDILAENKKIGGILIENIFKSQDKIDVIIGIGLNVNQTKFENLPNASSLKLLLNKDFNKVELLHQIVLQIENNYQKLLSFGEEYFWSFYNENLYRKNVPSVFEKIDKSRFQGIIQKVSSDGKLVVQLEDDSFQSFDLKEISLLY